MMQVVSWMLWDAAQSLDPDKNDDAKDLLSTTMKAGQLAEAEAPLEDAAGEGRSSDFILQPAASEA